MACYTFFVQLFAGTNENDPQAFCNDPTITTQGECVGEFVMKLKTSREFLATDVNNNEILVPRVWSVIKQLLLSI